MSQVTEPGLAGKPHGHGEAHGEIILTTRRARSEAT